MAAVHRFEEAMLRNILPSFTGPWNKWMFGPGFLLLWVGVTLTPAIGQGAGQGAIEGTVTDSSGAVVPNAVVTVTDQSSGISTTRTTSSAGLYTITPLIPDSYTVTVKAKGFLTSKQQNIVVNGLNVTG